jgi:hypothetical protein
MKNIFKIVVLFFGLITLQGCEENNIQTQPTENSYDALSRRICPDGFTMVVKLEWKYDIFEKFDYLTCKGGWGFCFQVGPVLTFDCVRNRSLMDNVATFNTHTGEGSSIGIPDEINKTYTFYFHKDMMSAPEYQNKDFNFLSIGNDLYISSERTQKLIEGNYPKIIEGDYIKYIINYEDL